VTPDRQRTYAAGAFTENREKREQLWSRESQQPAGDVPMPSSVRNG
jgi:hypothetical protein